MDGAQLQPKIQYGYAKCAEKIGSSFNLYRSPSPINPISPNNLLGVINCSANVSWEYMTTQKYGKAVWNLIIETRRFVPQVSARVGDYLVPVPFEYADNSPLNEPSRLGFDVAGALSTGEPEYSNGFIGDKNVYFVGAEEYLLPILGVNCNRTLTIIRPTQAVGAGYQGYAGYTPPTSLTIMSGMPASVLEEGTAGGAPTKLPTDTKEPRYIILMPNLGNVILRSDDIVVDDLNQEYVITDAELTFLGWRVVAEQVVNSR